MRITGTDIERRLRLGQGGATIRYEDGKARCLKAVRELTQAFLLAVRHPETARIRDDVALFQNVRSA